MKQQMNHTSKTSCFVYSIIFRRILVVALLVAFCVSGCAKSRVGGSDGESHFLRSCDAGCQGGLSCVCGVCTKECENDQSCEALSSNATCVDPQALKACQSSDTDLAGICDVACDSRDDCLSLGADYECRGGFCRIGNDSPLNDAGSETDVRRSIDGFVDENTDITTDALESSDALVDSIDVSVDEYTDITTDALESSDDVVDSKINSDWELVASGTNERLSGIWGFNDDDIWVAGYSRLLHHDGETWKVAFENVSFKDLWGAAPDDIWAIGSVEQEASGRQSGIFHYDGIDWQLSVSDEALPYYFNGIWGTSGDDIYAFLATYSQWQIPWHWDGSSWKEHDAEIVYSGRGDQILSTYDVTVAHGTSPDNIVVADFGGLIRYDGKQWTVLEGWLISEGSPAGAAWVLSSGDFLVGLGSEIYRYHNDESTLELDVPVTYYRDVTRSVGFSGIWGFSDTDIFAVGYEWSTGSSESGIESGTIATRGWHYDGQSWSEEDLGDLAIEPTDIWGSPSGVVWVVGDEGMILRHRPHD